MKTVLISLLVVLLAGCQAEEPSTSEEEPIQEATSEQTDNTEEEQAALERETEEAEEELVDYEALKASIVEKYEGASPQTWGENVEGVVTQIDTDEKKIALTFDACIGTPNAYDAALIDFLIEEDVPATLFFGGHWIEAYEEEFMALAEHPLFEVANHGYDHKPLSVDGNSAYGIPGTQNTAEVFDEIYYNQQYLKELTGEYPKYFRSGTAYYDEVAVEIAQELGLTVANYNVLGDAGATFSQSQIVEALTSAQPGAVYLFHMNHPESDVAEGVEEGVLTLKAEGYEFVQLQEVDALLK